MDVSNLPPLFLAYIGDAVYEVYVRTKLLGKKFTPIWKLHKEVTHYVCAAGQDLALRQIEPYLSPQEAEIVRRGRNTKGRVPKNVDVTAYRRATGFEALCGWLYLTNQTERLKELLTMIRIGEEN
ncbi:MAG: Mini-ribonuclease 3 [Firmicutes bacterium]|nr:Mini-ribonuclease 3 [Bacillota bacterium]